MPATAETSSEAAAAAINRGLGFLGRAQLPSGEFATYVAAEATMREPQRAPSPFASALVLSCLRGVSDRRVGRLAGKALDFLEGEAEPPGVWRFWSRASELHALVPPDLDDTCCVSHVLRLYGRPAPANADVILANSAADGRFYTWLAPRGTAGYTPNPEALLWLLIYHDAWRDIDAVVNANVLVYLGEQAGTAGAVSYLLELVSGGREAAGSRYYPGRLAFYYMLTRASTSRAPSLGQLAPLVAERTLARQDDDGWFGTALDTALGLNVLLDLEQPARVMERAVGRLLAAQRSDGAWPAAPLFVDPARHYGSPELTTAFCLEALAKYARALDNGGRPAPA